MEISNRFDIEKYWMRGTLIRKSDYVHLFSRTINGKRFDFSRVEWSGGGVTIRAWAGGTTRLLHEWKGVA